MRARMPTKIRMRRTAAPIDIEMALKESSSNFLEMALPGAWEFKVSLR